eukprot:m.516721 g.516721  ORF g.516721 m.516721 type:complete len:72 (+) comp57477_c1_seq1:252-467(+)
MGCTQAEMFVCAPDSLMVLREQNGESAIDLALKFGQRRIARMLQEHEQFLDRITAVKPALSTTREPEGMQP